jgi:hypothetical protein
MPIVGLEPSCTAALRSDLPRLLDTAAARQTADRVTTFAGLLVDSDYKPPRLNARSLSQTHCHQHADSGTAADSELLRRAGVDNTELASGCCGLAGNFGFERGHYEVSVAAAEQMLLPQVRGASAETVVLADGFSCPNPDRPVDRPDSPTMSPNCWPVSSGDDVERPAGAGQAGVGVQTVQVDGLSSEAGWWGIGSGELRTLCYQVMGSVCRARTDRPVSQFS